MPRHFPTASTGACTLTRHVQQEKFNRSTKITKQSLSSGIYFLRGRAAVGVQNNLHRRVRAAGPLVRPLPHAVREARVVTVGLAQEQGVRDQSLGGDICGARKAQNYSLNTRVCGGTPKPRPLIKLQLK